jgi:hypothetical protein
MRKNLPNSGNDGSVPALKAGAQKIDHFKASPWNGLLDLAGYPKTSPYGGKPSAVPPIGFVHPDNGRK